MSPHLATFSVVCLGWLSSGCSTTPALVESRSHTASASASIAAADLRPAPDGTVRWRSVAGLLEGSEFDIVSGPSTVPSATYATRTADIETAHWAVAADGSVVLVAVDSHPDRTRSIFTPPLLLAPPSLEAGVDVHVDAAMRAVLIPSGTSERDRGTGTRTIRYVGDETITVDGTPREAQVAEIVFIAEMAHAKAERHSRLWVVRSEGIVAEEWSETLTIMKFFTKRSNQTSMRVGVELPARKSLGQAASDAPTQPNLSAPEPPR